MITTIEVQVPQQFTTVEVASGIRGPVGPQGTQGATGPQGPQGLPGDAGPAGPAGPQGPQGIAGDVGPQGPQGPAGGNGASAYQAAVAGGFVGTEAEWLASLVGAQGLQGDTGPQGPQGLQGLQGIQGIQGDIGPIGPQGLQGIQGIQGDTGPQGIQGIQGDPGISAYQVAVAGGFVGTEAQWLASLVGPQGIQGPQGDTGPAGTTDYNLLLNLPFIPSTKADIGLANVDNTSDADKPISTATQTALNGKIDLAALPFKIDAANTTFAIGTDALGAMTPTASDNENTAIGINALKLTNDGNWNVAIGSNALSNGTSNWDNIAIGPYAAQSSSNSWNNVSIGSSAASANVSGKSNTVVGAYAFTHPSDAYENIAIGTFAFDQGGSAASYNTVIGAYSFKYNGGNNNVVLGNAAASANQAVTSQRSVFIGAGTGASINGLNSGRITLVGANAYANPAVSNANAYMTAIGSEATVTTPNTVVLGRTTDVTVIGATADNGSGKKLQVTGGAEVDSLTVGGSTLGTAAFQNTTVFQSTLVSGTSIKTINGTSILGSGDLTVSGGSSTVTIDNKSTAYTVVAGDLGKIINCTTNSFTVSLTAAATLGAGFNCWVWNAATTSGVAITIDPSGAETIDGVATLVLRPGEGVKIVCDGANFQTEAKKASRMIAENFTPGMTRPIASWTGAVAIGVNAASTNTYTIAMGNSAAASGGQSTAIGYGATVSAFCGTAIGTNSAEIGAVAAFGNGALALGGSYASGVDSCAASISTASSSFGAQGTNAVALGYRAKATGNYSFACGYQGTASGNGSFAGGFNSATASAQNSFAFGYMVTASGQNSIALGDGASTQGIYGKQAFAPSSYTQYASGNGIVQIGKMVLFGDTSNATPRALTSNASATSTTNQVILPNSSTYRVTGKVVAMQKASDGTNTATYSFEALVRRGANAAATVLKWSTVTTDYEDVAGWDLTLAADTTNGGLSISITGAAATNIRTVVEAKTVEVTYA